jgi:hypothetical protein
MTTQVLFNQFAYADHLKRGGFTDDQARASAEALGVALSEAVATKSDVTELRTELKGDIAELRTELKGDIARLNGELADFKSEFNAFKIEVKAEFATMRAENKTEIATLRTEIASNKNDIVRWVLVLNFAMVGVLLTAMKLLLK